MYNNCGVGLGITGNGNMIMGWEENGNFGQKGDTYMVVGPNNLVMFCS
jgi:hypothetical protein